MLRRTYDVPLHTRASSEPRSVLVVGSDDGSTELLNLDELSASTDETVVIRRPVQSEDDES